MGPCLRNLRRTGYSKILTFVFTEARLTVRITSKGQVTIPQDIRERAGLLPHTEVAFEYVDGKVVLQRSSETVEKNAARIRAAIEKTRGSADEPMFRGWSTDRIMAFLRPER